MIELYNNLMALTAIDKAKFFYSDVKSPLGTRYRIFSYNYASYNDWLLEDALECRGIMFEMGEHGPVRIASRPMEKFFNLNENPFTMSLELSEVKYLLAKEDGSLISTFIDSGNLRFKSKGSISSEQAAAANSIVMDIDHKDFADRLFELAEAGFTANLEYVSPTNRIVLPYQTKKLVLLNVRDNDTGEYIDYEDLYKDAALRNYLVDQFEVPEDDWVQSVRDAEGIEGYIAVMENGLRFKLKSNWYVALHNTKDSISTPEKLFNVIVNNAVDDLKGLFIDDPYSLTKIEAFEESYLNYLSKAIDLCNTVYQDLRGKDRKVYAIESQARTKAKGLGFLFTVIMNMYQGEMTPDELVRQLNTLFSKNYKNFIPLGY